MLRNPSSKPKKQEKNLYLFFLSTQHTRIKWMESWNQGVKYTNNNYLLLLYKHHTIKLKENLLSVHSNRKHCRQSSQKKTCHCHSLTNHSGWLCWMNSVVFYFSLWSLNFIFSQFHPDICDIFCLDYFLFFAFRDEIELMKLDLNL